MACHYAYGMRILSDDARIPAAVPGIWLTES
jgi:hypothetical protein